MFNWLEFLTSLHGAYFDKNTAHDVIDSSKQQRQNTQTQYTGAQDTNSQRSNEQYGASIGRGTALWDQFSNLASTGGISQEDRNRLLNLYQDPAQIPGGGSVTPSASSNGGSNTGGNNTTQASGITGGLTSGQGAPGSISPQNNQNSSGLMYNTPLSVDNKTPISVSNKTPLSVDNNTPLSVNSNTALKNQINVGDNSKRQFSDANPVAQNLAMTGGVDMSALRGTQSQYQNVIDTDTNRSFDAGRKANITNDQASLDNELNSFRGMQMNGGLDQASIDRFRGGGVYDTLANTGGYDPQMKSEFLQRATSTVPAQYQQMADEITRRRNVQGGYAPGFDASKALLARSASQGMNESVRNANLALNQEITKNKLMGAQGMTSSEQGMQGLRTGNILKGATGAAGVIDQRTNANLGLEKQIQDIAQANTTNKLNAIGGLTDSEQKAQQLQQQGKIAGGGFLTAQGQALTNQDISQQKSEVDRAINQQNTEKDRINAQLASETSRNINQQSTEAGRINAQLGSETSRANEQMSSDTARAVAERNLQGQLAMAGGSNSLANAQIQAQKMAQEGENQRFLIGSTQSGMMGGLSGMNSLFGSNVSAGQNYNTGLLNSISGQAGNVNNLNGTELNAGSQLKNPWDYAQQGIGMAGTLMTGLPSGSGQPYKLPGYGLSPS